MIGIKRRKKTEGWAQEVSEPGSDIINRGFRQRLADSNKLWLLCFVVLLGLSFLYFKDATGSSEIKMESKLPVADAESYDPAEYQNFAVSFGKNPIYGDILVETPEFSGPGRFRLVVSGDTSRDDIEYVSRMAARLISYTFKHRVTVQVYMQRANGSKVLAAHTTWNAEKGYNVKFKGNIVDLLK